MKEIVIKGKEVKEETMELINSIVGEELDKEEFINGLITYKDIVEGTTYSLEEYIRAFTFVSFLETSKGNYTDAYIKAFIDREFVKERMNLDSSNPKRQQLISSASRYRKTPLVMKIIAQSEVPLYLMFQGYRYEAINCLVKEMHEAKHSKDRVQAADRLLTHLKEPDNAKIEINVGTNTDNIVSKYESIIKSMASKQKELLDNGEDIIKVSNAVVEYVDTKVEND